MNDTAVKLVLVTAPTEYIPNAPATMGEFPAIPGIVVQRFASALEEMTSEPVLVPTNAEDTCLIMYTGGTTGLPKGAVTTHGNVIANITV